MASKTLLRLVGILFIAGINVWGLKWNYQLPNMLNFTTAYDKIAEKCNEHGGKQAADEFWSSLHIAQACFGRNRIFVSPKEDYLNTMKNCTGDLIIKAEACLSEETKYYPSLFTEAIESLTEFAYDHLNPKTLSPRSEIVHCLQRIKSVGIKESFDVCIQLSSPPECSTFSIPNKTELCKQWLKLNDCFNEFVKKTCIRDIAVDRFLANLTTASQKPCRAET